MHRNITKQIAALSAALLLSTGMAALPANAAQNWMTAYANKYSELKAADKATRYGLADIDQDGVPEMITASGSFHVATTTVYTFDGNDIVELGTGGDYGTCGYQPELKRFVATYNITGGGFITEVYLIVNHKATKTVTYSHYVDSSETFYIDGKKTTETAYKKAMYDNYLGSNTTYKYLYMEYGNMTTSTFQINTYTCKGDANTDGRVDASDAAQVLMAAARAGAGGTDGLSLNERAAVDLNGDSKVNASDAALILGYAAKTGSGWVGTIGDYLSTR